MCFGPETLQLFGIQGNGKGQDLERDATAERKLNRFVHDAHAAAAQLAEHLEIAQRVGGAIDREARPVGTQLAGAGMGEIDIVEALRQLAGEFGIELEVTGPVGRAAGFEVGKVLAGRVQQTRVVGMQLFGRVAHVCPSTIWRMRARPRSQSFSTLVTLRPMRSATWGKVSPCRCRSTITSR